MAKKSRKGNGEASETRGLSRRRFLSTTSAGAVGAAAAARLASGTASAAPAADVASAGQLARVELNINGQEHRLLVEPRWTLLHVLREKLGMTGAKVGCERGECGSCTVLIDDQARYACMTLAMEAQGTQVTTVEGLLQGEELGAVQQAFLENDAFQCGYCTPGQVMAVEGLLRANPDPSLDEIRLGVSGNLCRCGAYPNIFKAAEQAAELKRKGGRS